MACITVVKELCLICLNPCPLNIGQATDKQEKKRKPQDRKEPKKEKRRRRRERVGVASLLGPPCFLGLTRTALLAWSVSRLTLGGGDS